MKKQAIDNPEAFPACNEANNNGTMGMTLRDYFAAAADVAAYSPLKTLEVRLGRPPAIEELAKYISAIRLLEADAMLAERMKAAE